VTVALAALVTLFVTVVGLRRAQRALWGRRTRGNGEGELVGADGSAAPGAHDMTLDRQWRTYFKDCLRLRPYLRRYRALTATSFSMVGVGALLALAAPWPLAIVIDSVLGHKPLPAIFGSLFGGSGKYTLLAIAVGLGVLIVAAQHGFAVLENYVNTRLSQRIVLDFRSDLFEHVQKLSLGFHEQTQSGLLFFRMSNEAEAAGTIVVTIPPLVQSVVTLVLMFVIAFRLDTALALIALAVVPFIYYSAGYYTRRIEPTLYAVRNLEGETLSLMSEAMAMIRVVVAFGREGHEHSRFRRKGEQAVDARVRLTVRQTVFGLAVSMITALGTAGVLAVGGIQVIRGNLTPGELVVMLAYVAAMYQPLEQISNTISVLQQYIIYLRYALGLLDTEPEVKDLPEAVALDDATVAGHVAFDHVSFTYPGRERTLEDITFEARHGQRIAIVGPTGAGKTTLASLVPRFHDPAYGSVLLDGRDIRGVRLDSLRRQVSFVHQEPLLFNDTIAENIRYGRLAATQEEIVAAAQAANAHDFIMRLPEGYDTGLGERGAKLSGGERQRLSLARAFVKDAPILILDEPTSAIDSRTESAILEALERLMTGRTTFIIAHRLSTIREADLVLVVNDGRIVERGTHAELVAADGLYRQLSALQGVDGAAPGNYRAEGLPEVTDVPHIVPARLTGRTGVAPRWIARPRIVERGTHEELVSEDRYRTEVAPRWIARPRRVVPERRVEPASTVTYLHWRALDGRSAESHDETARIVLAALAPLFEYGSDHALRELAARAGDGSAGAHLAPQIAAAMLRELEERVARDTG
jgi:ATP-binding cassette subfamily B protein/subfamily B ATP-binding cassette protein MsbA